MAGGAAKLVYALGPARAPGSPATGPLTHLLAPSKQELKGLAKGDRPFTLVLEDPSGNSFIASAGEDDAALSKETYTRSVREALAVGIPVEAEVGERQLESVAEEEAEDEE